jgi:2-polyprenyl-3-methyl-5-hydroxy-6-metoxy-1,4-benzoquinol methylase
MTLPFVLSAPRGYKSSPQWNGSKFVYDDQVVSVLEYSENFAGWSDELTALHEATAGDSHPLDLASRNDALLQVRNSLPISGQVAIMEIGCSSGFLIRDLVRAFPHFVVIGADVVKEPLLKLAKQLPSVPLIRFDLLQCTLPEGSFDIIVMLNVLEHINDDMLALQNAYKLLKPGGSLVIEVPAGKYLYDAYDSQLHHFRRYSASELSLKLEQVGFTITRRSHLGFLLFPAFALVKLKNKLFSLFGFSATVGEQVALTSRSFVLSAIMRFERKYLSVRSLPFGIRVLMTGKRPL